MRQRERLYVVLLFVCKVQTDNTRTRTLVKQHGLHRQTVMLVLVGQLGVVRCLYIPFEIRVSAIRKQQRKPALCIRGKGRSADAQRGSQSGADDFLC